MSTDDNAASDTVDLEALERRLPSWTRELLRCLTPRQRQALVLREASGMTFEEVSLRLRVTASRARQLHVVAVQTLDAAARRAVMLGRVEAHVVHHAPPVGGDDRCVVPPRMTPMLELPVEALNLSTRGEKCLENWSIKTIGQLVLRTDRDLLKMKNMGRKTVGEIESALAELGLHLGMDVSGVPTRDGHEAPPSRTETVLRVVPATEIIPLEEDTDRAHRAQQLVYQAWETGRVAERISLARDAIALYADCADGYNLLADEADDVDEAIALHEQAMKAGERVVGQRAFEEDVGHFWLILETRPYMRAREGLAARLWERGDRDAAVEHYRDLLRLNPNDNQGIRYLLAACLVAMGRDDELAALLERYNEDAMAAWAYTKALLAFRREGDCERSRHLLDEAMKMNLHVPAYLLGKKTLPRLVPDSIGLGDDSEAVAYVAENLDGWTGTPGALEWIAQRG